MLQINTEYSLQFNTHDSRASLQALVGEWQALITRCGAHVTPFQTPEWCLAWLEANLDALPLVVTIRKNDQLVFLAPLMREDPFPGLRILTFLTCPDCKYGQVLWDEALDGNILFGEFVAYLQDQKTCDLLLLNDISEDQPWVSGYNLIDSELEYSSILDITDEIRQDYITSLPKRFRRDIKQTEKRLEETGRLTIDFVRCDAVWLENVFPKLLEWKSEWLSDKGFWGGGISDSGFVRFVEALIKAANPSSTEMLSCVIKLDGRMVAADMNFVHQGAVFSYFSSYDPTIEKVSLGTLRDYHMVEWLVDNQCRCFDLLGHPERYKQRLTNRNVKLVNLHLALTFTGKFARQVDRLKLRDLAKSMFYLLPAKWRKSTIGLLR